MAEIGSGVDEISFTPVLPLSVIRWNFMGSFLVFWFGLPALAVGG